MIFVKSEYRGEKESRIIPALPSGMDIPPKKPSMNIEGHPEFKTSRSSSPSGGY